MKKLLLFCLLLIKSVTYAQQFINFDHTVPDIANQWRNAGSSTFKKGSFNPFAIIIFSPPTNTNDYSSALSAQIDKIATEFNENLVLLYIPEGTYTLNTPLIISSKSNLIIKGAGAGKTILNINHGNGGIILQDCATIGLEDFTIYRDDDWNKNNSNNTNDMSGSHNFFLQNCNNCWFNGIYSYRPLKSHIRLTNSSTGITENITISGCTFTTASDHSDDGGEANGITIDGSKHCLIENNIFHDLRHSINFQLNAFANVVAYNGSFKPNDDQFFIEQGDLNFHGRYEENPGPNHNLMEGNTFQRCVFDCSHCSNGPFNLLFRNKLIDGVKIWGNIIGFCSYCSDSEFSNSDQSKYTCMYCS